MNVSDDKVGKWIMFGLNGKSELASLSPTRKVPSLSIKQESFCKACLTAGLLLLSTDLTSKLRTSSRSLQEMLPE